MTTTPRPTHLPLQHQPSPVRVARQHTADTVRSWGIRDDLADDLLLIVSELVTNAEEHGGGACTLRLTPCGTAGGLAVRADVVDVGAPPAPPAPDLPDAEAEHGRGLVLIDALAADHGCRPTAGGGMTCWACVAPPVPACLVKTVSGPGPRQRRRPCDLEAAA